MELFLPDLTSLGDWVLVACVVWCAVVAFSQEEFARTTLGSSILLLPAPWIVLAGLAAENARHFFASMDLEPSELVSEGVFDLTHTIPLVGLASLLMGLLLLIAARRFGSSGHQLSAVLGGVLPGALLIFHSLRYIKVMKRIAQSEGGIEPADLDAALSSGIVGFTTVLAGALLATVVFLTTRSHSSAKQG